MARTTTTVPQWAATLLAGAIAIAAGQASAQFTVHEIPTLGGDRSTALGVNNAGQVVGSARNADGLFQPVLWENGVLTNLNPFAGTQGNANAINNNGEIVGFISSTPGTVQRGFYWNAGDLALLEPTSGSSAQWTEAMGINDHGQISGSAQVAGSNGFQAYIWDRDNTSPVISVPQVSGTGAGFYAGYAINNNGQMTGYYQSNLGFEQPWRGYIYQTSNNLSTDVGTLGDDNSYVEAWAINDKGHVVGYTDTNLFFDTRAFILTEDGMQNLGTLGGDFSSALGINNDDWVVGTSRNESGQARAFLWRDGVMEDLNDFIDPDSGWILERAQGISDTGWIIGLGQLNGEFRGFAILIPAPGAGLLLGLAGLAAARRRRN
ncbi:MAG: hypothetical protein EA378_03670 [Phycisphaerales bacterium]|nr:MAG: hypothetical protein EA378_03670 [Phycisphaerales bacterium]